MDVCKDELLVLATSEKQNIILPKIRTGASSKYNAQIMDLRLGHCPSPLVGRTPLISGTSVNRSQSAERKRPNTPPSSSPSSPSNRHSAPPLSRPSTPPSSTSSRSTTPVRGSIIEKQNTSRKALGGRATDSLWPSMRSLSSSFHSESFDHMNKKDKSARCPVEHTLKPSSLTAYENERATLTGRNVSEQSENYCPFQSTQSRVVDQHRWPGMKGGKVSSMTFSRSMDLTDRIGKTASLMLQSQGISTTMRLPSTDCISKSIQNLKNLMDLKESSIDKTNISQHDMSFSVNESSTYPSKTSSLPVVSLCRPSSLNKASAGYSSSSKGAISQVNLLPTIRYTSDNKKGLKGTDIEDAHHLRLFYNFELLWCFVNSRAEAMLANQRIASMSMLNDMCNAISELHDSVALKRINVQRLKQKLKLEFLLKEQVAYLEDWIALEEEHSTSLSMTVQALKSSTIRLPINGGARADVRAIKNAVSSAIDVMQAMGSSVCHLLSKVEGTKGLVLQVSAIAAEEKELLDESRVLLAATAAMQVEECSLITHILQQLRQDMHVEY
ncbi:hypothetical protein AXF42_Ash015094 [Apostasia shenzhenica]|uniref:Uncharacterized protein n=1 Tax=Apostasia shenzhenica TaxID=1088818 RepID=A0A2I0B343_9ASPA|nr:hypothetical protein AXF42_Ash015094 [Apostasia shenzhenica]